MGTGDSPGRRRGVCGGSGGGGGRWRRGVGRHGQLSIVDSLKQSRACRALCLACKEWSQSSAVLGALFCGVCYYFRELMPEFDYDCTSMPKQCLFSLNVVVTVCPSVQSPKPLHKRQCIHSHNHPFNHDAAFCRRSRHYNDSLDSKNWYRCGTSH